MKHALAALFALALAATAFLGCQPQQGGGGQASQRPAPASEGGGLKVAIVRNDTLLERYEFFTDMQEDLQRKGRDNQRRLQKMGASYQRDLQSYQQRMQAGMLSQVEAQQIEQELMAEEQKLQKFQNTIQLDLMERQSDYNEKVSAKIDSFLVEYNKGKGYDLILNYVPQTTMWLVNEEKVPDITQEVLAGLNEAYREEKKQEKAADDPAN